MAMDSDNNKDVVQAYRGCNYPLAPIVMYEVNKSQSFCSAYFPHSRSNLCPQLGFPINLGKRLSTQLVCVANLI